MQVGNAGGTVTVIMSNVLLNISDGLTCNFNYEIKE